MDAIELDRVVRRFGTLVAVDDVSLSVQQGEVFGLLGHNGAGKTTLIRLIDGVYARHGGSIKVHGLDPRTDGDTIRRHTGVLTESPALDGYLSPTEILRVYAQMNGVSPAAMRARVPLLLEYLGLRVHADKPAHQLSTGLRQLLALARALVHDPTTLLLDEPTANLDPVAARTVRDIITGSARDRGRTVLLSTHNLAEAEAMCDRVAILRNGRVLAIGAPSELRQRAEEPDVARIISRPQGAERIVRGLSLGVTTRIVDEATVEVHSEMPIREVVALLVVQGIPIDRVDPLEPTLEDLYVELHSGAGQLDATSMVRVS